MDPAANIEEQHQLATMLIARSDNPELFDADLQNNDAVRLAELVIAFIEWRKNDGFDPFRSA